ncbi:hypothetical protein [Hymenobacter chitinivorans]|uniref:LIVCS family branched-chain amino acid:cation transporter n=1 Tax=Hymenobacter chitinivorans DSM 11115 TaxID=1121954 RepID=A0A2M9BSN4_9BACT|nr:hypothetical protein [Hymenobacter chitinivorans]PJJ60947.1 hypothetical protein CLV45_2384 [Hymenobacter chitinivorans DSM 11115]
METPLETPPVKSAYTQPLLVNTVALVLVGLMLLPIVAGHGLEAICNFIVAAFLLPVVNCCFFLSALVSRNWKRAFVYGLLTVGFLVLAWEVGSLMAGAFHKIGG